MDVRHLKYFVAIVECGSLSKAAAQLFVSQPSLSQHITNLESELNTVLLLRSPSGVKPTEAGTLLYREAQQILRQMDDLRRQVTTGIKNVSGSVTIGLPTTIAAVLAAPLLEQTLTLYPGIRLHIIESMSGYISELLANGRLDLAILFRDTETRGVSIQPLFDEDLYVIGNAGLSLSVDQRDCPLSALAGVPLVAPGGGVGLRLLIERTFARENLALNIIADIDSLPTMIEIACRGTACTILPPSSLMTKARDTWPPVRKISEPGMSRPASLCWSTSIPTSAAHLAIKVLIPLLVAQLQASGQWVGIALRASSDD
jgi:LysR family nitrogen assimilation transcriptional regulator